MRQINVVFCIAVVVSIMPLSVPLAAQEVIVLSQEQKQNQIRDTKNILRLVSDNIISKQTYEFVNVKTKQKFTDITPEKADENIRVTNRYSSMHYINGPLITGLIRAGEVLNDSTYYNHSIRNFRFIFDNAPLFKHIFDKGIDKDYAYRRFFDMKYKDGCCSLAAALTDVSDLHSREDVKNYFQRATDFLYQVHPRMDDGTLARDWPNVHTVWADDLYMLVPFLVRMGKITGNVKYFDEAVKQVEQYNKYLFDEISGLYYHGYFADIKQNNSAHWLRANGWIALAQVEVIDFLPEDHPGRQMMIAFLQRQIVGFSRYQDISGIWRQLISKPDSYIETSGSAMFIYAVARAVNKGWIDHLYFRIADEAWKGLLTHVTDEGMLKDVCVGTGMTKDLVFYYRRPVYGLRDNASGSHGIGALLLAGSEMINGYEMDHPLTRKGGGY